MPRPDASVCIPAYNAEAFVADAISSALRAAGPETEVVVVDDKSTDATWDIVRSFSDARVMAFRNDANLGRADNINRVMHLASGATITVLPADSVLPPNSLRDRLAALAEAPSAAFVYGAAQFIDESGKPIATHRPHGTSQVLNRRDAFASLLPRDPVYTITALIKREAYEWSGGLRTNIAPSHRDWDFFLRLATRGGLAYISEVVALERQHANNFTQIAEAEGRMPFFEFLILDAILRWTSREATDLVPLVHAGRMRWAETQLGHAIAARAGQDPRDPVRSIGLALMAEPRVVRTRRFLAAVGTLFLPETVVRRAIGHRLAA